MPIAARRPCWKVGCPNYQPCGVHPKIKRDLQQSRRYDDRRGSASERGYGYRWQKYAAGFKKCNPFCVDPYKRHPKQIKATEHVDHIEKVSGPNDPKFWDVSNHQGLCQSCHSWKTAVIDGGFGHPEKSNLER